MTLGPGALAKSSDSLGYFLSALGQREGGDSNAMVRISWWGDSAVAGDGYTGQLRRRLQERFGDGGAGYLLASPTFRGYVHGQIRLKRNNWKAESVLYGKVKHRRYGLAGIHLQSYGGASSTFIARDKGYDTVTVYLRGAPRRGELQIYIDEQGLPTATHSAHRERAQDVRWVHRLDKSSKWIRVRAAGGGLMQLYGVALERSQGGVVLDTLGQVGLRARGLLRIKEEHFIGQVGLRRPNLVAIHFGGNERVDAKLTLKRHQREIEELLGRLKRGALMASCLVVGPLPHGRRRGGTIKLDPRLEVIGNAQKAAAKSRGCAYFDTIEHLGGESGLRTMVKERFLARDLAHLTTKGHQRMGDLLAQWLFAKYDARQTRDNDEGDD